MENIENLDPKINKQISRIFDKNHLLEILTKIFLSNYYDVSQTEDYNQKSQTKSQNLITENTQSKAKRPKLNPLFDEELNDSDFDGLSDLQSQNFSQYQNMLIKESQNYQKTKENENHNDNDKEKPTHNPEDFHVISHFINDISEIFDFILTKIMLKSIDRELEDQQTSEESLTRISIQFDDVFQILAEYFPVGTQFEVLSCFRD